MGGVRQGGTQRLGLPRSQLDPARWLMEGNILEVLNICFFPTAAATADKLLVVHYEHFRNDPIAEVKKILKFLKIEEDPERLNCLLKFKNGYFKRKSKPKLSEIPFSRSQRSAIDKIIRNVNEVLVRKGYQNLPTEFYNYYEKTEREILESFKRRNSAQDRENDIDTSEQSITGSKMLLEQYIRSDLCLNHSW